MFDQIIAVIAGIGIGFIMGIPVGPVGLMVFKRSMFKGQRLGLITGLGSALTDGFFASIGAFGITVIWHFIVEYQDVLRIGGGIIILITGLFGVFAKSKPVVEKKDTAITMIEHFFSGIILTATNPLVAFSFFVIFASVGKKLGIGTGVGVATGLVSGVILGALLWWITLTYIGKTVGHKVKQDHIDIINKCFGLVITLIGAAMIIGAILK